MIVVGMSLAYHVRADCTVEVTTVSQGTIGLGGDDRIKKQTYKPMVIARDTLRL